MNSLFLEIPRNGDVDNVNLKNCTLQDLQPLLSKECLAQVDADEDLRCATSMFERMQNINNDNIIITKNEFPIGILNGKNVLKCIFKSQMDFRFHSRTTEQCMSEVGTCVLDPELKFLDMLKIWKKNRVCFSIIHDEYDNFYALSPKTIIDLSHFLNPLIFTDVLQKKPIIFIDAEETIDTAYETMMNNETRRLIVRSSNKQLNDRNIIQKFNKLIDSGIENFNNIKISEFELGSVLNYTSHVPIRILAKDMLTIETPCAIIDNNIITPWDLISFYTDGGNF